MAARKKLGELLIEAGALSEADVRVALAKQKAAGNREKLGAILLSLGYTTTAAIARALATQLDLPFIELPAEIPSRITALVPVDYQAENRIIPFGLEKDAGGERLLIAVDDPARIDEVDDLRFQLGKKVRVFLAGANDVDNTLAMLKGEKVEEIVGVALEDEEGGSAAKEEPPELTPVPFVVQRDDPDAPPEWDLPPAPPKLERARSRTGKPTQAAKVLDGVLGAPPPAPVPVIAFPPKGGVTGKAAKPKAEVPEWEVDLEATPADGVPVKNLLAAATSAEEPAPAIRHREPAGPTAPHAPGAPPAPPPAADPAAISPSNGHAADSAVAADGAPAVAAVPAPGPTNGSSPSAAPPRSTPASGIPVTLPASAAVSTEASPGPVTAPGSEVPGQTPSVPGATPPPAAPAASLASPVASNGEGAGTGSSGTPAAAPKLEFTDEDLKMLDALERIALGSTPLKKVENVTSSQLVFTLIRLLIHKGVIQEQEIFEELARK